MSTQASSFWVQKHNKHTLDENCHLFIKWRSQKIHILEENCHWYIKWHSKENNTKSYTNFVLQNCPSKMGENIYTPKYCRTITNSIVCLLEFSLFKQVLNQLMLLSKNIFIYSINFFCLLNNYLFTNKKLQCIELEQLFNWLEFSFQVVCKEWSLMT